MLMKLQYSVLVVQITFLFFFFTVIVGSSTQYLVIGRNDKQYLEIGWHSWDANSSVVKNDYSKANKNPVYTLFIYLATVGLSCSVSDLLPWPGVQSGPPELGGHSLSYWTTRQVPPLLIRTASILDESPVRGPPFPIITSLKAPCPDMVTF